MINRLIFRRTTWLTSWTKSRRNLQLSRGTWYLLWQFHIALSRSQTELKFHLHSPFLGSSPLMEGDHWESILRPGGVRGRNQTYKSCSFEASGKISRHLCPDLPVSCCPSRLQRSGTACCLGRGRKEEKGEQEAWKTAS